MLTWLCENAATLVIGGLLLAAVAAIVVKIVRDRKKGKSTCGCGCSSCPMGGACQSKK